MSVDTRPNGSYRVRWRPYPGAPQQTRTFPKGQKAAADKFDKQMQGAIVGGTYVDPNAGREGFAAFADAWAAAQDWKAGTRRTWPTARNHLVAAWGDRPLASIDTLAMQTLQNELLRQGYAIGTVKVTMAKARAILRAAYTNGRIPRDPTVGFDPRRRGGTNGVEQSRPTKFRPATKF